MKVKKLGSDYGGWTVDLDSISDGDTIICGGVGEDITFEEGLLEIKNVNIIAVDPTYKSHIFLDEKKNPNIKLIKCAIEKGGEKVKLYKNIIPNHVSESIFREHNSVGDSFYEADIVTIKELIDTYNPSFIKIDIEGSEYNVLEECIGIKQVCVEFHHHIIENKTIMDTTYLIDKFEQNGYIVISNSNNHEVTFLRK